MTASVIADTAEDSELIQACLRGNQSAWRIFVDRYSRLVYSIPRRYGLSTEDSNDVFQNVFAVVARRLSNLRDEKRLAAWLITITQRECQRVFKSHSVPQVELQESTLDPSVSVSNQTEIWERQHLVRQAILQLDPDCRYLITTLFMDPQNPTYRQIAASLNIPVGSVGPTRTRCLKKLEATLISMGVDLD